MAAQFMFNKTVLPLAKLTCLVRKLYSVGTVLYASGHLTVSLDSTHGVLSCSQVVPIIKCLFSNMFKYFLATKVLRTICFKR